MADQSKLSDLHGYIVSLSISGSVTPQFSSCYTEMRSYNETTLGWRNIEYSISPGIFVERARDDAVKHALNPAGNRTQKPYDWILQIDADATFPRETLQHLLTRAYVDFPDAGAVGAYVQLKGGPNMPAIDTGSGKWEEHYPGEGMLPVIRTGAHCILIKTWVFGRIGPPPWFRTRPVMQPIKAFREVDNFARIRLSGQNPLATHPEWETLMEQAAHLSDGDSVVGEDSAFFDRCRSHDVPVYVDCDLLTGHVANKVIQPKDFLDKVREGKRIVQLALGVG